MWKSRCSGVYGPGEPGAPGRGFLAPRVICFGFYLISAFLEAACSPNPSEIFVPAGDIRPPTILDAGQDSPGSFKILFDEEIQPIAKSFAFDPAATIATPGSEGALLTVSLEPAAAAGQACSLSGEARDGSGNTTRFLFSFVGYNEKPALLRVNELQTGKNSSASNPHRDYVEFTVEEEGNLGGVYVQWASSVKIMAYAFPPCDVAKNSVIVLHCAPEGDPSEVDETGGDLSRSGGVDASASGRDFWAGGGGIPDETGLLLVKAREGDAPMDGVFFVSSAKTGELDSPKLTGLLEELTVAGLWASSSPPQWEDGFQWKSSASRPLHRMRAGPAGAGQWQIGESGSQSPGVAAPGKTSSSSRKVKKENSTSD
ncbi:MAG TPA: hypothetical protein VN445_10070 [Rectinemataceae bacterium]|nr:hypothetical protein [Rectinemataceae bacterium]